MSYATLIEGRGFLSYYGRPDQKDALRLVASEQSATLYVDGAFLKWDRSTWSGAGVPAEIREIADKWGSAEYITRGIMQIAPQSDRAPDLGQSELRSHARDLVETIKARGWIMGHDGEKLLPIDADVDDARTVRCTR